MNLKESILQTIHEEHIAPTSRFRVWCSRAIHWVFAGILILLGGISLAVILYLTRYNDWDVYQHFAVNRFIFVLYVLPYAWLIVFALLLFFVYRGVRSTSHGYRRPAISLALIVAVGTVFCGVVLHGVGVGDSVDASIETHLPSVVHQTFNPRLKRWIHPERGFLTGQVSSVETASFILVDPEGAAWLVRVQGDVPTFIRDQIRVRAIGEAVAEREFAAKKVLPWQIEAKEKEQKMHNLQSERNGVEKRMNIQKGPTNNSPQRKK